VADAERAAAAPSAQSASGAVAGHASFLVYRGGRYAWIALGLCAISTLLYVIHDPVEGKTGSTWLGYTLGTIGAGLIAWLAWLGVRKRQVATARAPMQAWVSAHVYLGLALVVVGTLHAGFQMGWNVHTLAYVLMLLVIASGIYGVAAYSVLPARITATRNQMEFRAMVEQVHELNETLLSLADRIDAETHSMMARSVSRAQIGGSAWQQLTGRYPKLGDTSALDSFFSTKKVELETTTQMMRQPSTGSFDAESTVVMIAGRIFARRGGENEAETLQKVLQTQSKRNAMLERVNRDITLRARLNVWLYVHVPLTVGLLVALFAHVLSVFLYW
jgi:hypothetical protein